MRNPRKREQLGNGFFDTLESGIEAFGKATGIKAVGDFIAEKVGKPALDLLDIKYKDRSSFDVGNVVGKTLLAPYTLGTKFKEATGQKPSAILEKAVPVLTYLGQPNFAIAAKGLSKGYKLIGLGQGGNGSVVENKLYEAQQMASLLGSVNGTDSIDPRYYVSNAVSASILNDPVATA